jgi:drug/metabolite transporter (DMT)-like permease
MSLRKLLGIVLLAGGTLVLIYRGFTYTSEKHTAHLGPIDFQVKEKKRLDIPIWAGVIAIVAGAGFLVLPQRKG